MKNLTRKKAFEIVTSFLWDYINDSTEGWNSPIWKKEIAALKKLGVQCLDKESKPEEYKGPTL